MTLRLVLRRTLLVVALVLLLVLAWTGIKGGIEQLSSAHTRGQQIQTIIQLVYGVLSIGCILTVRLSWNRSLLVCWTIALALGGGLGAVAWGQASLGIGLVSGLAAGLVGAGIAWLLRFGAHRTLQP